MLNIQKTMEKYKYIISKIFLDNKERKLNNFLKNNTSQLPLDQEDGEILIEQVNLSCNIIALFYFLKGLRNKHRSKLVSYILKPNNLKTKILEFKYSKLFRSLGVSKTLYISSSEENSIEVNNYYEEIKKNIKTKKDLENLHFGKVWIGDLIYDSVLRKESIPTVDLESKEVEKEIKNAIGVFLLWEKYFKHHKVKAVIVSHTVYVDIAIVSRYAAAFGIDSYQINDYGMYKLSETRTHAYNEFSDFKTAFEKLPEEIKSKGLKWADNRLKQRFEGEVGVDMSYSTKSAWNQFDGENVLSVSKKKKVFVALHCFFDSPHPYGLNLFPDFYEWLTFLGELSNETDYEWYLKTHPDFLPGNKGIVDFFVAKYEKFSLLDSATSHHQIISSGVDVVLTVYGTIGMEYAYFGIPVINASENNIHSAFNFNLHPKTINEYRDMLANLEDLSLEIEREEILKYYFMRHKACKQSWLYDHEEMIKYIGGVKNTEASDVIDYYFSLKRVEWENQVTLNVDKFLDDNQFCFWPNIEF